LDYFFYLRRRGIEHLEAQMKPAMMHGAERQKSAGRGLSPYG
jgi:hypothetical protein